VGAPRLLRRRRGTAAEPKAGTGRQQLIEEIAALDEAHAAGGVEEGDYAARRAELKDRLRSMTAADAETAPTT
jgi:predicted ATPase